MRDESRAGITSRQVMASLSVLLFSSYVRAEAPVAAESAPAASEAAPASESEATTLPQTEPATETGEGQPVADSAASDTQGASGAEPPVAPTTTDAIAAERTADHVTVPVEAPAAASAPPPPLPVTRAGPRRNLLLIGPGFGFSFIYPREINDYLDNWADYQGVTLDEGGTTAMILSFQPKLAITFAPIEYVQLQFVGEVSWAPKIFSVIGGDSEVFHFLRYTTGMTVAGHIPISNGRRSISFGAGGLFNVLKFEDYQEIAPGVRGLFGFRFYGRRAFTPEIFLEYNWIRADTDRKADDYSNIISELNYSSVTIGGNFYFTIIGK